MLQEAAGCNDDATAEEHYHLVDGVLWLNKLKKLSSRDDLNAKLSGFAFAIVLERNEAGEEECAREVSRRLSPGIPADIGSGWFEGMSMRNRYALLSEIIYGDSLMNTRIRWRRNRSSARLCFGGFEPREKEAIAELLDELNDFDFGDI